MLLLFFHWTSNLGGRVATTDQTYTTGSVIGIRNIYQLLKYHGACSWISLFRCIF